eukprot:UN34600
MECEANWGCVKFQTYFIDDFWNKGYRFLRVPVKWDYHLGKQSPYTLDNVYLKQVAVILDYAMEKGFYVIVNSHHDDWMDNNPNGSMNRFKALWTQISYYFRNRGQNLFFEILNEPNKNVCCTSEHYESTDNTNYQKN